MGRLPRLARRAACVVLAVGTCGGCAAVYEDADGARHVVGLVSMTIRPPADPAAIAGDVVDVTVVGIALHHIPPHGGLTIGYSRETAASIRNHALVLGNPLQAIQR